jgi:hypothetical protein
VAELRETAPTTPADAQPARGGEPWEPVQIRANFALLARDLSEQPDELRGCPSAGGAGWGSGRPELTARRR